MRVLVTGQIGLDKKQYLDQVAALAQQHGEVSPSNASDKGGLKIFHIGDMMYREAPDVPPGRAFSISPSPASLSLRRAPSCVTATSLPRPPTTNTSSSTPTPPSAGGTACSPRL